MFIHPEIARQYVELRSEGVSRTKARVQIKLGHMVAMYDLDTPILMGMLNGIASARKKTIIAKLVRAIGRNLTVENNGPLNDNFMALTDEFQRLRQAA